MDQCTVVPYVMWFIIWNIKSMIICNKYVHSDMFKFNGTECKAPPYPLAACPR